MVFYSGIAQSVEQAESENSQRLGSVGENSEEVRDEKSDHANMLINSNIKLPPIVTPSKPRVKSAILEMNKKKESNGIGDMNTESKKSMVGLIQKREGISKI